MDTATGSFLVGDIDELIVELEAQFDKDMELGVVSDPFGTNNCTHGCTGAPHCVTE